MKAITFECETITPMFLGGADGRTPELRPPSIKGLMRFWWRAMNAHLSLEDLKEEEAKIFGGSGEKEGRSKVTIRVYPFNLSTSKDDFPSHPVQVKNFKINILEYLAYGTYEYERGRGNIFIRDYIIPDQKFSISITAPNERKSEIINVFQILSTFGGLGSRARNGFGSFRLLSIDGIQSNKYYNVQRKNYTSDLPNYSAFSQNMQLWKTKENYDSWDNALAELGRTYREARTKIEQKHSYEKRQYISAPIIVHKNQVSILDRHSKPYFMSVHREENRFIGNVLYLPSEYVYGIEQNGLNNTKETKLFNEACESLNKTLSDRLVEVIL
jgi:CRISPR-associated protein Cmr1